MTTKIANDDTFSTFTLIFRQRMRIFLSLKVLKSKIKGLFSKILESYCITYVTKTDSVSVYSKPYKHLYFWHLVFKILITSANIVS